MKTRLIQEIGARIVLNIYEDGACPNGAYHLAAVQVLYVERLRGPSGYTEMAEAVQGRDFFTEPGWPATCACSFAFTSEAHRSVVPERVYDTPLGKPAPGDLYFVPCPSSPFVDKCFDWDDCSGVHLHATLPNGDHWDIDSRANNCCKPDDRRHRCWTRQGDPAELATFSVTNTGNCGAGGGSIKNPRYHGMLTRGEFNP